MKSAQKSVESNIEEYGVKKLYWRCFVGLLVTSLVVTVPLGIVVCAYYSTLVGVAIILSALGKPVAYAVSEKLGYGTEGGEWGTGFLMWGKLVFLLGGIAVFI